MSARLVVGYVPNGETSGEGLLQAQPLLLGFKASVGTVSFRVYAYGYGLVPIAPPTGTLPYFLLTATNAATGQTLQSLISAAYAGYTLPSSTVGVVVTEVQSAIGAALWYNLKAGAYEPDGLADVLYPPATGAAYAKLKATGVFGGLTQVTTKCRTPEVRIEWKSQNPFLGLTDPGVLNGTAVATCFSNHMVTEDCTGVRLWFVWGYNAGSGGADVGMGNAGTITASVEWVSGQTVVPLPVTFNHASSYTFPSSTEPIWVLSDPLPADFVAGTKIRVRTAFNLIYSASTGSPTTYIPSTLWTSGADSDGWLINTDATLTANPTVATSSGANLYGPSAIVGRPTGVHRSPAGIVGDSIARGTGETGSTTFGWVERALTGNGATVIGSASSIPYVNLGHSGAAISDWTTIVLHTGAHNSRLRILGLDACEYVIFQMGINSQSAGLATMKAHALGAWRREANRGLPIVPATLSPRTGSSDAWATVANQWPGGSPITAVANSGGFLRLTANSANSVSVNTTTANTIELYGITGVVDGTVATVTAVSSTLITTNIPYVAQALGTNPGFRSQTSANSLEAARCGYNNWLRSGQAALDAAAIGVTVLGYLEATKGIEVDAAGAVTIDGGYFAAARTSDGLHALTLGHIAMAAQVISGTGYPSAATQPLTIAALSALAL